jgi:hypothetical protein
MMEDRFFECPWTGKPLRHAVDYDLDHQLPVSVYPINELWNLAPTDRRFNQHVKRDRLPTHELLIAAAPRLDSAKLRLSPLPWTVRASSLSTRKTGRTLVGGRPSTNASPPSQ